MGKKKIELEELKNC